MHLSRRSVGRNSDYYSSVPRVRSYSYFIPSDEDYDTQAQELINIYKHYARAPVVYSHHTVSTTPNFSRFDSQVPTRAMARNIATIPRRTTFTSSFDDSSVPYSSLVRVRPIYSTPTCSTRYCHSHPPSAKVYPLESSRFWYPSSTYDIPSSYHYCPALRKMAPAHSHSHPRYASLSVGRSASEYRYHDPDEYLAQSGSSLEKLRSDLRITSDKFGKHRQLIDKYLRLDPKHRLENVEPAVIRKYDEVAERIPELLIMNYGLYRRPLDTTTLWSRSIEMPERNKYGSRPQHNRLRTTTPFEIRGRIRSVVSRTAQSCARF